MSLSNLKHAICELPRGGKILVLNTGAQIPPESEAMLQALHSRSVGGVIEHLEKLAKNGPEKFMSMFYVGYNHKSIGDCGSATLFIEGVSMLAAKAIQDSQLYSGQESSTRYIDFAKQKFHNPIGSSEASGVLDKWRDFYLFGLDPLKEHLRQKFPLEAGEDEKTYEKAIDARAFDIMRGFLPAGASTNLAWHTNLRQMADRIMILRHHPLQEVREIAIGAESVLKKAFPSSFGHKIYSKTEEYNAFWMTDKYYFSQTHPADFKMVKNNVDFLLLEQNKEILKRRPQKTELPKYLAECGTLQFEFLLDFGSFRDIQRHRAVIQRMPLVTMDHGFAPWYLEEMPSSLRNIASLLVTEQERTIRTFTMGKELAQYYIPMGYQLPNRLTGDLPALVYLVELRASSMVHPTLQKRAVQIAQVLEGLFGSYGLKLHIDLDSNPGRFDIRRGEQDIVEVEVV